MSRSEAEILWQVASVLARDAAKVSRAAGRPRPDPPPLLFFTDPRRTPRPWETAARLPPGAAVVFRAFGAADARDTAARLREVTARRGVLLLIGRDSELAETTGADGVHLPERALAEAPTLAGLRPDWRLTGAAHGVEAFTLAAGLEALVLSPVFAVGGPSGARPALGVAGFSALARQAPVPVYALGGLDGGTAGALVGSGACGLAGVSAVQRAFGPAG